MKNYEKKNLDVESTGDFESTKMSIDAADTGFIFDLLFNQMYRDPIGSIIREITSNCFDSHIEAKVNDAVVVEFSEDENGRFISFKDVGVGLSPERIRTVYSKPGKSTKRDSNDQIGYFGLGSKSPFSYVEEGFFVDSIYDGMLYNYIIHKGTIGPEITLITSETTSERNGTIVKIYFKKPKDETEFKEKINKQLRYFDNVYVKGYDDYNNDYKIHIGKTFKFRNDCKDSLHICMGKVNYPIDWDKLGISKINLPFGLKFDIGELPVTPERESVRYGSIKSGDDQYIDTREIIKNRIKDFKAEIQELLGTEPIYYNNFIDYYEAKGNENHIELLGIKVRITNDIAKGVSHYYEPFKKFDIEFNDAYFFNIFMVKRSMDTWSGSKINNIFKGLHSSVLTLSEFQTQFLVREFKAVSKFKSINLDYLRLLAKQSDRSRILFIDHLTVPIETLRRFFTLPKVKKIDYSITNKVKLFKYVKDTILRELILHSIDYHDLVIPDDFKTQWELNNKKTTEDEEIEEGEIGVYNIRKLTKSDRKEIWNIEENIERFEGFVLYGFEKDEELLESYADLFKNGIFVNTSKIIKIRIKDEKTVIALKNTIYVRSFMSNNDVFKKVATATYVDQSKIWNYKFHQELNNNSIRIDNNKIFGIIFSPLGKTIEKLEKVKKNTVNIGDKESWSESKSSFLNDVVSIAKTNNWLETDVVKDVDKVEKYLSGLELINYIVPKDQAVPHIANFFQLSGKQINKEWNGLESWQEELLRDSLKKYVYQTELNSTIKISSNLGYTISQRMQRTKKILEDAIKINKDNIDELITFNKYNNGKTSSHTTEG